MARNRRKYSRSTDSQSYKKLFVISTEGSKTEPLYFSEFNDRSKSFTVKPISSKGKSSPQSVLKKMKGHIDDKGLRKSDEAWLVVDKDQWSDDQLAELFHWCCSKDNYHLALSNPKFEYWILLHFEDGNGVSNPRQCMERLKTYLPNYEKSLSPTDLRKIIAGVSDAVKRAERKDTPSCRDWPRSIGSTVYRLLQNIEKS